MQRRRDRSNCAATAAIALRAAAPALCILIRISPLFCTTFLGKPAS